MIKLFNTLNNQAPDTDYLLPPDAPAILSRANFLRIQALNEDNFGLRGTLIGTQDLVNSVITVSARNTQTRLVYSGNGTLYTIQGAKYDYWTGESPWGSQGVRSGRVPPFYTL